MSSPARRRQRPERLRPDTSAPLTQRLPPHGSVPRIHIVKDTRDGRDPLDEHPIDPESVAMLREQQETQQLERIAWGPVWNDAGLVFTREDGRP